jgi:hypothetical protein
MKRSKLEWPRCCYGIIPAIPLKYEYTSSPTRPHYASGACTSACCRNLGASNVGFVLLLPRLRRTSTRLRHFATLGASSVAINSTYTFLSICFVACALNSSGIAHAPSVEEGAETEKAKVAKNLTRSNNAETARDIRQRRATNTQETPRCIGHGPAYCHKINNLC